MAQSDVLTLIKTTYTNDLLGIPQESTSERDVLCSIESVTRAEFFDGGRNGINPSLMFKVFAGDYDDEQEIRYKGKAYSVYRTYFTQGNEVEIYVTRKGGTNAKNTG